MRRWVGTRAISKGTGGPPPDGMDTVDGAWPAKRWREGTDVGSRWLTKPWDDRTGCDGRVECQVQARGKKQGTSHHRRQRGERSMQARNDEDGREMPTREGKSG